MGSSFLEIAAMTPEDFGALKEGELHSFWFIQPDGKRAPVKVKIERQGDPELRRIRVDLWSSAFDLTELASSSFLEEYKKYYKNGIKPQLFKKLTITD